MQITRPNDYTPGRPIGSLADMANELLRIAGFTKNKLTFRGVYTPDTVAKMTPSARPLDMFIIEDAAGGTQRLYVQLTTKPRVRFRIDGAMENA